MQYIYICVYIYLRRTHAQIGCYMPRLAMRVLYVATPAYRVFKAPAAAQSVRGYSKRPSLPIAPEAVQSVRGLSMRLSLLKAHCVLGPDLYSLQVTWRLLSIYMRRLAYAIRVLHDTPSKEGAICIYIYMYIYVYMYMQRLRQLKASDATQSARGSQSARGCLKRPMLVNALEHAQPVSM